MEFPYRATANTTTPPTHSSTHVSPRTTRSTLHANHMQVPPVSICTGGLGAAQTISRGLIGLATTWECKPSSGTGQMGSWRCTPRFVETYLLLVPPGYVGCSITTSSAFHEAAAPLCMPWHVFQLTVLAITAFTSLRGAPAWTSSLYIHNHTHIPLLTVSHPLSLFSSTTTEIQFHPPPRNSPTSNWELPIHTSWLLPAHPILSLPGKNRPQPLACGCLQSSMPADTSLLSPTSPTPPHYTRPKPLGAATSSSPAPSSPPPPPPRASRPSPPPPPAPTAQTSSSGR